MSAPMKPMPKTRWDHLQRRDPALAKRISEWAIEHALANANSAFLGAQLPKEYQYEFYATSFQFLKENENWESEVEAEGGIQAVANKQVARQREDVASFVAFEVCGKKTFFFSENLIDRLANTEINVPAEVLRPPFPTCMFVFDSEPLKDAFARKQDDPVNEPRSPVNVFIRELDVQEDPVLHVSIDWATSQVPWSPALRTVNLHLKPGRTLEDAILYGFTEEDRQLRGEFFRDHHLLLRVITNAMLYLSSRAPEISGQLWASDRVSPPMRGQSSKAKKRLAAETGKYSSHPYIEVGSSLPSLDEEFEELGGRKVTTRFMVRGHYRNQAHGEGRTLRRLQWIQPFWKGPEMADVVSKPYRVDGGK